VLADRERRPFEKRHDLVEHGAITAAFDVRATTYAAERSSETRADALSVRRQPPALHVAGDELSPAARSRSRA
jgi:hypothetical protein